MKKSVKIFIVGFSCIAIVGGSIFGVNKICDYNKKLEVYNNAFEEYECYDSFMSIKDFRNSEELAYVGLGNEIVETMELEMVDIALDRDCLVEAWWSAIFDEYNEYYGDFNSAICDYLDWHSDSNASKLNKKITVEENIKKLKGLSEYYPDYYNDIISLYNAYDYLVKQTVFPTGSYQSYVEDTKNKYSKFDEIISRVSFTAPNKNELKIKK